MAAASLQLDFDGGDAEALGAELRFVVSAVVIAMRPRARPGKKPCLKASPRG